MYAPACGVAWARILSCRHFHKHYFVRCLAGFLFVFTSSVSSVQISTLFPSSNVSGETVRTYKSVYDTNGRRHGTTVARSTTHEVTPDGQLHEHGYL